MRALGMGHSRGGIRAGVSVNWCWGIAGVLDAGREGEGEDRKSSYGQSVALGYIGVGNIMTVIFSLKTGTSTQTNALLLYILPPPRLHTPSQAAGPRANLSRHSRWKAHTPPSPADDSPPRECEGEGHYPLGRTVSAPCLTLPLTSSSPPRSSSCIRRLSSGPPSPSKSLAFVVLEDRILVSSLSQIFFHASFSFTPPSSTLLSGSPSSPPHNPHPPPFSSPKPHRNQRKQK